jgi:protein-S-isoprenylcysteine O-methyltransferase Ste14
MKKYFLSAKTAAVAVFLLGCSLITSAYDFVAYDDVTGEVTFTPEGLVTPLITGIIAILATVAAIWVIFWGVRYLKRVMGR